MLCVDIMITNIQSLICEINPRGKLTQNVLFYIKKNIKLKNPLGAASSPIDLPVFTVFLLVVVAAFIFI